jgi:hypothetical protein
MRPRPRFARTTRPRASACRCSSSPTRCAPHRPSTQHPLQRYDMILFAGARPYASHHLSIQLLLQKYVMILSVWVFRKAVRIDTISIAPPARVEEVRARPHWTSLRTAAHSLYTRFTHRLLVGSYISEATVRLNRREKPRCPRWASSWRSGEFRAVQCRLELFRTAEPRSDLL